MNQHLKNNFNRGILAVAGITAFMHFAPNLFGVFTKQSDTTPSLFYGIIYQTSILLPAIFALLYFLPVRNFHFPMNPFKGWDFLAVLVGSSLIGVLPAYIAVTFFDSSSYVPLTKDQVNTLPIFLSAVVVAPLLEELIFRGLIQQFLHRYFNPALAIITSSVIFSFLHDFPFQAIGIFGFGLGLSYLYYRTQSLLLPIIIHFLHNLMAWWTLGKGSRPGIDPDNDILLIIGSCVVCSILSFLGFKLIYRATRKNTPFPLGKQVST